jgi:hypothetical protein
MVNYFSSSPSTFNISGGACMCGTGYQSIEPFYEDPTHFESEQYSHSPYANGFYDAPSNVAKVPPSSDPISGLFSQYFESPVDQQPLPLQPTHQQSPLNPMIENASQKMGIHPNTLHTMIQQTATSFGVNPSELKENVAHFFAKFGISKETVQSALKEIASQIGLNNKMGYSGTINPNVIQKQLEKSNIPVKINSAAVPHPNSAAVPHPNFAAVPQHNSAAVPQHNSAAVPQPNSAPIVNAQFVHNNKTNMQKQLDSLNHSNIPKNVVSLNQAIPVNKAQNSRATPRQANAPPNTSNVPLVKPNVVEIPAVYTNQGVKEPVIVKPNGVISTPSNKPLAVTNTGVLTNKQNGTPVTVNNAKVVKNSVGQLVNSQTGNPVTVIPLAITAPNAAAQHVNNQAVSRNNIQVPLKKNTFQNAPQNTVQPTYTNSNWQQRFPQMSANNLQKIKNYTKRHEGVDFGQVDPASLQDSIDRFLQEYSSN